MRFYQVIARDLEGLIVQKSDPHTWEECQDLFHDYLDEYEGTISIAYIGSTTD